MFETEKLQVFFELWPFVFDFLLYKSTDIRSNGNLKLKSKMNRKNYIYSFISNRYIIWPQPKYGRDAYSIKISP